MKVYEKLKNLENNMKRKRCYSCHNLLLVRFNEDSCFCPECGKLNEIKRTQTADLTGKVALLTGGRFNIGFQTGLKLLRAGATVYVTSRFPLDTISRYSKESDFKEWKDRLKVLQVDFRDLKGVLQMIQWLNNNLTDGLDILINNAAQTIRRPFEYYRGLVDIENETYKKLPGEIKDLVIFNKSGKSFTEIQKSLDYTANDLGREEDFPLGQVDYNGWQLDLRPKNSWNLEAMDISPIEFLEVQTVNSTVPFMLCSYLKDLFIKSKGEKKYIINVAASAEGSFGYPRRNSRHPHLNMAKAALNMLTHTIWRSYKKDNIFVNSVDTGWVNYEGTYEAQKNFYVKSKTPLDAIDGAARILDPIFTGSTESGKLYKDYHVDEW